MRVYHFLNEKYGLEDLKERRLKVSRIMELNDPFEFLAVDMSDRGFRKGMNEAKRLTGEEYGLICFSANWKNPVQWSHYAEQHKGICLGFDIPDELLEKVDYVPERLSHNGSLDEDLVMTLLTTKFNHWEYEEEYRIFLPLLLSDIKDGKLHFTVFGDHLNLRRVIVGAENKTISRAKIAELLGDIAGDVEVFKARAGFKKFEVVEQLNKKLWS